MRTALLVLLAISFCSKVNAQLNPFGAMYFENQYLANPAYAGSEQGFELSLGYKKQLTGTQGSPVAQNLTAQWQSGVNVGLGLNIFNEKVGVFKRIRVLGTYAYIIPLKYDNQRVHFGLSFGFQNQRIDENELNGETGDIVIDSYNNRGIYLDGAFGVAYTSNQLNLQGSIPNLKYFFKKDLPINIIDRATIYLAASYKFALSETDSGIELEPKLAFRGVHGFNSIFDVGTKVAFNSFNLNLTGMYHSSNSASFGLGFAFKKFNVYTLYNTSSTQLNSVIAGNLEINMKLKLGAY